MRHVEDLDAVRERATVVQDELNNRIPDQMNKTMCVLTVVAAILLPLSLLTGLLEINVGGMPGVDSPLAFSLVALVAVEIVVLLLAWDKFHEHGIQIPFPQRDLHLESSDEALPRGGYRRLGQPPRPGAALSPCRRSGRSCRYGRSSPSGHGPWRLPPGGRSGGPEP
ncbi:MAG: hypothetical protein HOH66_07100 [Rhodospirillaceae bacterium]|nr:hypothetical protein [Rhodospirillaceae bacterium]MBT6117617.1 hypothetical protein [Rhodospirillaceae bacterium]